MCTSSGRSDEVAASRGGRIFLHALLGGETTNWVISAWEGATSRHRARQAPEALPRSPRAGSALSLGYTYHSALSAAILEESKLMKLAGELMEPGAQMAGADGGGFREKLLARRGQARTPGEFPPISSLATPPAP